MQQKRKSAVELWMDEVFKETGSKFTIDVNKLSPHLNTQGAKLFETCFRKIYNHLTLGRNFSMNDIVIMDLFATWDNFLSILSLTRYEKFYRGESRSLREAVLKLLIKFAHFNHHDYYLGISMKLSEIKYQDYEDGKPGTNNYVFVSADDFNRMDNVLIHQAIVKCGRLY